MFRGSDFFLCLMLKGSFLNRHYKKLFPTEFRILLFNAPNTIVSELGLTSPTRLLVMVGYKQWWVRNYSGHWTAACCRAVSCHILSPQSFTGSSTIWGIILPVILYTIIYRVTWKIRNNFPSHHMYKILKSKCLFYQFATEAVRLPSQLQVPPTQHTILYNLGSYHQPHLSQWYKLRTEVYLVWLMYFNICKNIFNNLNWYI